MRTFVRYLGHATASALLFTGLAAALPAQAAILPDTIGYEGYLRDGATPVNGSRNLTFRIYDQEAGGTLLWTEPHNAVSIVNGVFQVRLGSIVSLSDDATGIPFDRPLFLSVQVEGSPEMTPRLALNVSPYSFAGRLLDSTVNVNCTTGGSVAKILEEAGDAFKLVIDISGNCVGNLHIDRDKVTIKSSDGTGVITGVTPADPVENPANAVVTVNGVQNVVLDNVDVVGAPGDATGMHGIVLADTGQLMVRNGSAVRNHGGNGISVVESSSLDVFGSTIENNAGYGISVYSGSHADVEGGTLVQGNGGNGINVALGASVDVRGSTVQGNGANGIIASWSSAVRLREGSTVQNNGTPGGNFHAGLFVNEGSSARVEDSTVSTEMSNADDGPAIGVYRSSTLRLRGTNLISAAAPASATCPPDCPYGGATAGGMAMDVEHGSTLRQDGGKSTITGQVTSYNLSTVDLRDAEISGLAVTASLQANARLRDQSPGDGTPTVTGTVVVTGSGELNIRNRFNSQRAIINGDVYCQNRSAAVPNSLAFQSPETQGYVNCTNATADVALDIAGPVGDVTNNGNPTTVTYTVTVSNVPVAGEGKVETLDTTVNVAVAFLGTLFPVASPVSNLSDPSSCSINQQTVSCFVPKIQGGSSFVFSFDVELPAGETGSLEVAGEAHAANPDNNAGNNAASATSNVIL